MDASQPTTTAPLGLTTIGAVERFSASDDTADRTRRGGGTPSSRGSASTKEPGRRRYSLLTQRDKLTLGLMIGVPTFLCIALIWLPTFASILLSFTNWQGADALTAKNVVGLKNYETLFTAYPLFWEGVKHNILWLFFFVFIATPIGIFFAVLLDREMRGTRIYQSIFYIPVVLSLAVVGYIWELQYTSQGFINSILGHTSSDTAIDFLGNPDLNLWAVLVAASWRHVGYILVLYLAGLKSVDPTLKEAASIDGANARQTFFRVVFPVMKPINTVVIVITVIESLRAFDIAYIINRGKNGLELLSTLITNNSISEASLIGFGSAIAVILLLISLGPIVFYLVRTFRGSPE
jgi:multiple sugar transport system permease protein/raffinose/stachyose/melibiose transport system permease protein